MIFIIVTRTERHVIKKSNPMYKVCDNLCFKSKNIYNYANYVMRQEFFATKKVIKYNDLTFNLKHSEPFKELGSQSAQHTLKMLCKSWKSYLVSIKDYHKNPSKYLGKPRLPKYKKKNGRHICVLTNWQSQIKNGYLYFAVKALRDFNNTIKTNIQGKHMQTRIIPQGNCYILEIVYEIEINNIKREPNRICGIDLGINNFATLVNNIGIQPIVINGKSIKSYNQYWNKTISNLKSDLKKRHNQDWSNRLADLTMKRNNKMDYIIHKISKYIVDYCNKFNIDTIVIGYDKTWKQESNLGHMNNQYFTQIPHYSFINKLKYKCENHDINLIETDESYTSGTSFLDGELPIESNYNKSRRIKRGLFKSNNEILINADVNAGYQIIKKVFPNVFSNGIEGVGLHPIRVNIV